MNQPPFKKLSETLAEKCPDIKLEDAKKVIIAYRDYMFHLRGGKDWTAHFCDICYCRISEEQANKTTMFDFNYCCETHDNLRGAYNVERARHDLGIKIEHMPMLDIFG